MMDALGKIIAEKRLRKKYLRAWHSAYKELHARFGVPGLCLVRPQVAAWSWAHSLASLTQHITWVRNALLGPEPQQGTVGLTPEMRKTDWKQAAVVSGGQFMKEMPQPGEANGSLQIQGN